MIEITIDLHCQETVVRKPISITHYRIAEYWRDKMITSFGEVITVSDYLKNRERVKAISVITDFGEPECRRCGLQILPDKIPGYLDALKREDFKKIWDSKGVKSKLQRCHIVPYMVGGSDDAENLFLLCERCHLESPDYAKPEYFLKDIYDSATGGRFELGTDRDIWRSAISGLNPAVDIIDLVCDNIKATKSEMRTNEEMVGIHNGLAPRTYVAWMIDSVKNGERYKKANV